MTTEEKIAHNQQVEQERAAYHKRRCEESEAYKRVYERMISSTMHDAMESQQVVIAIQCCCQQVASQMPNTIEQSIRSHEEVIAEREAIKEYELHGMEIQTACTTFFFMWLMDKMSNDEKLRNDFFSNLQALKEISEAEQAFNSKLELFDKYEL